MLEKQIEKAVCDYARSKGVLAYKFTSPSRAAVPDRLFIAPTGRVWFCEFKRSGAKPTPAQLREHHKLTEHNVYTFIINDIECGQRMVDLMLHIPPGEQYNTVS